ncbi:hypothetical protein B7463_g7600, partial [Scytalidium lignicola]
MLIVSHSLEGGLLLNTPAQQKTRAGEEEEAIIPWLHTSDTLTILGEETAGGSRGHVNPPAVVVVPRRIQHPDQSDDFFAQTKPQEMTSLTQGFD